MRSTALKVVVMARWLVAATLPIYTAESQAQAQSQAQAEDAQGPAYKLTVGRYHSTVSGNATDLNLRRSAGSGNVWLGVYDAPSLRERQWRLGADASLDAGALRWMPAVQLASHRYVSASLNVETGDTWFVGVGLGRTNLRPNTNLNFDPNDAYSLAAGLRQPGGASYQVQWIRDNRQNPDQRHLHLVYRTPLPDGQRFTFDLLHKQGLVDDTMIHRWGATLTYDWPAFFVRLAYDPNVNFSAESMRRLAVGTRF